MMATPKAVARPKILMNDDSGLLLIARKVVLRNDRIMVVAF